MRRTLLVGVMSTAAAIAATMAFEGDARACGGCFAPPENPTIVTDHRMILSVSKQQSTLYDQIKYSGAPDSFAWVLPISGTVDVGLSADVVFGVLDQMTQTQIIPPPRNCPAPPDCGARNAPSAGFGGSEDSSDAGAGGVTVTKREVVGPYETVQLKATDPTALETWLANNKFAVPADVKPVIDEYVNEKFDFLALKLLPGKDVQDMRPVRVTTQGANVALPLRMVAAGTGSTVGISLWVLGEGRYQPQNFPTFTISNDELVWDWTQNKSNYTDLRAQKTQSGQGKIWEIESSTIVYPQNVEGAIKYGYYGGGNGGGGEPAPPADDYLPVKDDQGNIVKTADQVREEDITTLFAGIGTATSRVTRLRADLAHAALATDLVVGAAADQSELPNVRQVTKEANQPLCPVYDGCTQVGTAPRDEAQARSSDSGGTFSCATAVKDRSGSSTWLGVGAGFLALALVNAARRRRA